MNKFFIISMGLIAALQAVGSESLIPSDDEMKNAERILESADLNYGRQIISAQELWNLTQEAPQGESFDVKGRYGTRLQRFRVRNEDQQKAAKEFAEFLKAKAPAKSKADGYFNVLKVREALAAYAKGKGDPKKSGTRKQQELAERVLKQYDLMDDVGHAAGMKAQVLKSFEIVERREKRLKKYIDIMRANTTEAELAQLLNKIDPKGHKFTEKSFKSIMMNQLQNVVIHANAEKLKEIEEHSQFARNLDATAKNFKNLDDLDKKELLSEVGAKDESKLRGSLAALGKNKALKVIKKYGPIGLVLSSPLLGVAAEGEKASMSESSSQENVGSSKEDLINNTGTK